MSGGGAFAARNGRGPDGAVGTVGGSRSIRIALRGMRSSRYGLPSGVRS